MQFWRTHSSSLGAGSISGSGMSLFRSTPDATLRTSPLQVGCARNVSVPREM